MLCNQNLLYNEDKYSAPFGWSSLHLRFLKLLLTMWYMPISSCFSEFPPAKLARNAVVVFFLRGLIASAIASFSSLRASTSVACLHCVSELLWLLLPFRFSSLCIYRHIFSAYRSITLFRLIFLFALGLRKYLLVLIVKYSVCLAVEFFPLLLEHLVADINVLLKCFRIEISSAAGAWCQIEVLRPDKGISSQVCAIALVL